MPKSEDYTVAQLEQMLETARRSELSKLTERREKLTQELADLDSQIEGMGGTVAGHGRRTVLKRRPGGRVQPSLKKLIIDSLQKSKKGLSTDDIVERVQAAGYKSNSGEFRKVVYLNLFNLKRDGVINHDSATKLYSALPG